MHRTLLAGRFVLAKHALIKALVSVGVQRLIVLAVVAGESAVFLALIVLVYRRQEV